MSLKKKKIYRKKIKLPGYGSHNNAYNDNSAVRIDSAGDHSSLRISKHIAPVCLLKKKFVFDFKNKKFTMIY